MTIGLRPFHPDDTDWLVNHHATHYAQAEGFDATFGLLVARIIGDFVGGHDPQVEAGWIAQDGDHRLGSIFCVRQDQDTAKLRLFYVVAAARGTGVAQKLLDACLAFAKDRAYRRLTLWTHESHAAAGAIYRRNGFVRVAAKPVHSFGIDLVEETWQITF